LQTSTGLRFEPQPDDYPPEGREIKAHHFDARIRRRVVLHAAAWDDPIFQPPEENRHE